MRNFITCGSFTFFPLTHYWMYILLSQSYFNEHLHLIFKGILSKHYGNVAIPRNLKQVMLQIVHAQNVYNHSVDDLCLAICLGKILNMVKSFFISLIFEFWYITLYLSCKISRTLHIHICIIFFRTWSWFLTIYEKHGVHMKYEKMKRKNTTTIHR